MHVMGRGLRSTFVRRLAGATVVLGLPALTGCGSLPKLDDSLAEARAVAESSKIFAADGTMLKTLFDEQNRENIALAEVPRHVRHAVIATEDARFYTHSGVDGRAIARAFFVNSKQKRIVEGGSTITQQYIKNALGATEKTVRRKIREAVLAYQLEERHTKDEILERYLNTVYFGNGAYGIETAALTYFSVHAKDLSVVQGALLAGLISSPNRYDPFSAPKEALARRNYVLTRMSQEKFIDAAATQKATKEKISLKRGLQEKFPAPYFVTYVERLIQKDARFAAFGRTEAERTNTLFKGGLRIHTTLDMRLQKIADDASRAVLSEPGDPYNGFVAVEPKTGRILAMVGGKDYFNTKDKYAKFNMAENDLGRQAGSAFKTMTLVAALERGISLEQRYRGGSRITITIPGYEPYSAPNYEGISFGGSHTLLEGTEKSINVVYLQVVRDVGPKAVGDAARRLGITHRLETFPSIALGTEEVTPLDMASAYATIANDGVRVPVTPVTKITDASGNLLWQPDQKPVQAIDPAVATMTTEALQGVVKRGTGRRVALPDRPAAGKTGTTDRYADAWFAGYVPQIAAVSWVGFPEGQIGMTPPRTRIRVFGGTWPGQIWQRFMTEALKGVAVEEFEPTRDDVVRLRIDIKRRCLATGLPLSDDIQYRYYMKGTEPQLKCEGVFIEDSVPDVVGRREADAVQILKAAGIKDVNVRRIYCPAYPTGFVCRQSPSPGSDASYAGTATIDVSDDEATATVPSVLGKTGDEARAILEAAGFTVDVRAVENAGGSEGCRQVDENRAGRVWLQEPCAGESARAGTLVRVWVNP